MNRTRMIAVVCGMAFAALLSGCGGSNSSSATIGGAVTGLAAGTSVSLTLNSGTPLTMSANGSFTFGGNLASGDGYSVVVSSQPTGQTCLVTYGSGIIDYAGNSVSDVAVSCSANVAIGVEIVKGLDSGNSVTFNLTLQNDPDLENGQSNTYSVVASATGVTYDFPNPQASGAAVLLPIGTTYDVSITAQPTSPAQVCTVNPSSSSPYSGGVVSATPIVVSFVCE